MRFSYVRLRTCAQYASMNEFTCSEHSVRIRVRKKKTHDWKTALRMEIIENTKLNWNYRGHKCAVVKVAKAFELTTVYTFFRSNSEKSKWISDSSGRIQKCANEFQIVQIEFRKF